MPSDPGGFRAEQRISFSKIGLTIVTNALNGKNRKQMGLNGQDYRKILRHLIRNNASDNWNKKTLTELFVNTMAAYLEWLVDDTHEVKETKNRVQQYDEKIEPGSAWYGEETAILKKSQFQPEPSDIKSIETIFDLIQNEARGELILGMVKVAQHAALSGADDSAYDDVFNTITETIEYVLQQVKGAMVTSTQRYLKTGKDGKYLMVDAEEMKHEWESARNEHQSETIDDDYARANS